MKLWTVYLLQVLTISPGLSQNVEPAIKVKISALGISRIVNITKYIATRELPKLEIPGIHGQIDKWFGTVSYAAWNIKIDNVLDFDYSISSVQDSWHVKVRDISFQVTGLWSYKVDFISRHGSFLLIAGKLGMEIDVLVGSDNRGMPTFMIKQCSGSFNDLQLFIDSWIIDQFKDTILREINKPCEILTGQVMAEISKKLSQYNPQIPVTHGLLFDVRLLGAPLFKPQGIQLRHKGEFFFQGNTTEAPFQPSPLPESNSSKMVSADVSSYVFNTFSYVTHIHGLHEGDITKENLPDSFSGLLNTSCTKFICIGFFIPQLRYTYPNLFVEIHYKDVNYPKLQLTRDGASSRMDGLYYFRVRLQDKSLAELFSVSVNMSLNMIMSIERNASTLHWKIKSFSMNATLTDTKIGWIPDEAAYLILKWIIRLVAIPRIDKQGTLGRRLPIPKGVFLSNSKLQFQDGYAHLEGDFDLT